MAPSQLLSSLTIGTSMRHKHEALLQRMLSGSDRHVLMLLASLSYQEVSVKATPFEYMSHVQGACSFIQLVAQAGVAQTCDCNYRPQYAACGA